MGCSLLCGRRWRRWAPVRQNGETCACWHAGTLQNSWRTSVWDGGAQRAADAWTSAHIVYRPLFVRSFNEALYHAFDASYMDDRTLVFGSKQTLFEKLYIDAYCGLRSDNDRTPTVALRPAAPDGPGLVRQPWPAPPTPAPAKTTWFPERIGSAIRCPRTA